MKNILGNISTNGNFEVFGFEVLNENEMLNVRGGAEPLKPTSRPKDVYDTEEQ